MKMTVDKAKVENFVKEMNAIPTSVIGKLVEFSCAENIGEISVPVEYSRVDTPDGCGEVQRTEDGIYLVELDNGETVELEKGDIYPVFDDGLPLWGYMWQPHPWDVDWIRENLETVCACGFRVYEEDDFDILLGIDGCGYDFYEAHWIPLYKARFQELVEE